MGNVSFRIFLQSAVLGLALATTAVFAESPVGTVDLFKGSVAILDTKGKPTNRAIKKGTEFFLGETIKTGADGRVKLVFAEGGEKGSNSVVLGATAVLKIERAATAANPNQAGTTLSLAAGEVRADVRRKYSGEGGDKFEVRTKNAVAGVRGTVFLTRLTARGQTEVATERGAVAVRGLTGKQEVMVNPGMFASVAAVGSVAAPKPIASNPALKQVIQNLGGAEAGAAASSSGEAGASSGASSGSGSAKSESSSSTSGKSGEGGVAASAPESSAPSKDAPPPGALTREPVATTEGPGGRSPASVGGVTPAPAPAFMGQSASAAPRPSMGGVTEAIKYVPGNQRSGDVAAQVPVGPPAQPRVTVKIE